MQAPATIADYQQLCDLAAQRGLAVELLVAAEAVGHEGSQRRPMTRLRLRPRADRTGAELFGTPIISGNAYAAARVLLERFRAARGIR